MIRPVVFLAAVVFIGFSAVGAVETQKPVVAKAVPTHADAAVFFAKYAGLFDRYVESDATLSECVSFLNKAGIYFGLLEVVRGKEFTEEDCARVMGQAGLVFSGEAEFVAGKVALPKDVESWVDFCSLNGVLYFEGYQAIVNAVNLQDGF